MKKTTTARLIWGRVKSKHEMVGKVEIEGLGTYSVPSYLLPKLKVGYYYNLTLEYSPFLNCYAIMQVKKVFYFKSITALAVDLIKRGRYSLSI